MERIIPILLLILITALSVWWYKTLELRLNKIMMAIVVFDLLIVLIILALRPFIFNSYDANNIILYFVYLATLAVIISEPIMLFKQHLLESGKLNGLDKKILLSYISVSILVLGLIIAEAINLEGVF